MFRHVKYECGDIEIQFMLQENPEKWMIMQMQNGKFTPSVEAGTDLRLFEKYHNDADFRSAINIITELIKNQEPEIW